MRRHYTIGIDFGTTYSSIFEYNENEHCAIGLTGSCSSYFYPTVVSYHKGTYYFGEQALKKNQCILDIKRMFGMLAESPLLEESKKIWEIENIVLRKSEDRGMIEIGLKNDIKDSQPSIWVKPEEVAAKFIRFLFTDNHLRITKFQQLVITCPADFNTIQRKVLMNAVVHAGFVQETVTFLHEPSAAAIAYIHDSNSNFKFNDFLVCDFGGGTFDLSLLDISNKEFTVKSTYGDRNLGGRDFDNAIFEWAKNEFESELNRKLKKFEIKQVKNQCQDAKIAINQCSKVTIDLVTDDDEEYNISMTRQKFEQISKPLIDRTIKVIDDFITKQIKKPKDHIKEVLLVGGSSNLYLFKNRIKNYFGKEPLRYSLPREAIAKGACYLSAMQKDLITSQLDDFNFNQRLSHPIGTDIRGFNGKRKFDEIIHKNDKIPVSGKKTYISLFDNQKAIHVGVYECEEIYLDNCIPIDEFSQKIPLLPKGKAQITVEMSIDENGILTTTSRFHNLVTGEDDHDYDFGIKEDLDISC